MISRRRDWLLRRGDRRGCAVVGAVDVGMSGVPPTVRRRRPYGPAMDVELLLAPHCPNAAAARWVLTEALRRLCLDVPVRERVGDYPSPTILVDGVDVMTSQPAAPSRQTCRLDVPTAGRVLAALNPGPAAAGSDGAGGGPAGCWSEPAGP